MQQQLYKSIGETMNTWEKNLNALHALMLVAILLGGFGVQIFEHEQPCPLCFLQRLGMLGVAMGALMNCRFGPHKGHYGLSLLSAVFGGFVALRQIALHICPGFPTFGEPFWGLSLYTWSFITFASSVVYIAWLLLIFDQTHEEKPTAMNRFCHVAFWGVILTSLGNVVVGFILCGFGACQA